MFMKGNIIYGNYMEHVMEYYNASKTNDNILIVAYEDVKKHPEKQIRRLAKFLGTQLSDAEMEEILGYTTFEVMSKNPNTNHEGSPFFDFTRSKFMRKGIVGDWKNHFTVAQSEMFDVWIEEHIKQSDIKFCYEL
ncbi:unnamed protein product [Owenia fusiformis]|uniref:Sulfotransferase domain-containing protein n=1 Tax=Owenia fusiformis TaxID=6347 RepID=A0A8S4Q9I4_OWEFU|nr:unnamed protein product [Owenia fusiformis]